MGFDLMQRGALTTDEQAICDAAETSEREARQAGREAPRGSTAAAAAEREAATARAMRWESEGYFRLNSSTMARYRRAMAAIGMVHWEGEHPPWPAVGDFGFDDWPDDDDRSVEANELRSAQDRVLRWTPEAVGICEWKLCSNDGWIVTPGEIAGALQRYTAWCAEPDEVDIDARLGALGIVDLEYWDRWIRYLHRCVDRDGFEVA